MGIKQALKDAISFTAWYEQKLQSICSIHKNISQIISNPSPRQTSFFQNTTNHKKISKKIVLIATSVQEITKITPKYLPLIFILFILTSAPNL